MSFRTAGIHHVTGIASDPQRNLDFYAGILGLRLVKRTVNFDDPTTYHFYFGDEQGSPGSILTFFPWPDARRGRQGGGQVAVTSFAILPSSVGFWIERLIKKHVEFDQPVARYEDERVIAFKDHEGFMGELVAHPAADSRTGWSGAGVPPGARDPRRLLRYALARCQRADRTAAHQHPGIQARPRTGEHLPVRGRWTAVPEPLSICAAFRVSGLA